VLQKIGEAAARGKMNFSELEKTSGGYSCSPGKSTEFCSNRIRTKQVIVNKEIFACQLGCFLQMFWWLLA